VTIPESSPDVLRGSSAQNSPEAFGSSALLRNYAAVVRRRWRWIAAGLVIGMVGGLISTFLSTNAAPKTKYYKATNTIVEADRGGENLAQVAFLLQSSDVQGQIATAMDIPVETLRGLISAQAQPEVSAIDVTAIAIDPEFAVKLADTSAKVLMDSSNSESARQSKEAQDAVIAKMDALTAQRADLENQIARSPSQSALLKAELDSVVNQYRVTYEQFQALSNASQQTSSFTVFQPATAVQINSRAFGVRYDYNMNTRGAITGATTAPRLTFSETDLTVVSGASRATRIIIGGLVGLILGFATAFTLEVWDDRIRRRDNLEAVTGLPVVVEVPAFSRAERQELSIISVDAPRSRSAELYRTVRTSVLFAIEAEALARQAASESLGEPFVSRTPVILVTSPSPGEGKTTTTSNVAAVFAAAGARTLVVDCDYRKPSIGKYLAPIPDLEHPDNPQMTRAENLWFIPAPRSAASPAVVIEELGAIIERWRDEFDIVLLDTPPMLTTNDATDLLASADQTLLVIRSGQTRSVAAERVSGLLARFGAPVIGTIFNGCSAADMEGYYGYYGAGYYGSGYYGSGYYGSGYYGSGYYGSSDGQPGAQAQRGGSSSGVPMVPVDRQAPPELPRKNPPQP
jgi:capsular exopolysaccharide synthesis family protein